LLVLLYSIQNKTTCCSHTLLPWDDWQLGSNPLMRRLRRLRRWWTSCWV